MPDTPWKPSGNIDMAIRQMYRNVALVAIGSLIMAIVVFPAPESAIGFGVAYGWWLVSRGPRRCGRTRGSGRR